MRHWRRECKEDGADTLRSKGLAPVERLSPRQWERLEFIQTRTETMPLATPP